MPDVAQPHLEREGTVGVNPYQNIGNIAPAGLDQLERVSPARVLAIRRGRYASLLGLDEVK